MPLGGVLYSPSHILWSPTAPRLHLHRLHGSNLQNAGGVGSSNFCSILVSARALKPMCSFQNNALACRFLRGVRSHKSTVGYGSVGVEDNGHGVARGVHLCPLSHCTTESLQSRSIICQPIQNLQNKDQRLLAPLCCSHQQDFAEILNVSRYGAQKLNLAYKILTQIHSNYKVQYKKGVI